MAKCNGSWTIDKLKGSFFCRIWFIFHRICTEKDSIHTVPTMNKNHIQRFWSTIVVVVILQSWIMAKKYQSPWELSSCCTNLWWWQAQMDHELFWGGGMSLGVFFHDEYGYGISKGQKWLLLFVSVKKLWQYPIWTSHHYYTRSSIVFWLVLIHNC